MKRLYILTCVSVLLSAAIFFMKKRVEVNVAAGEGLVVPKEWLAVNPHPLTPAKDVRPADQTFLTFPEWFLVFSPEEQANYFKHTTATTFPFMNHIKQIWGSYHIINDQIKDNFPTNTGYHFMIWVIGSSATAEYAIKAWYETVIGRITDTGTPLTEEDKFNAKFTQDYVDFIKDLPWYAFDFKSRLVDLWTNTPFSGDNLLRSMERRYMLTSELLVKYGYGKLIGLGTQGIYEEALLTTAVVLDNDSLLNLPRYDKFAKAALDVAVSGHSFKEIAGNTSAIMITVMVPAAIEPSFPNTVTVFTQPVASDLRYKRVAVATTVKNLSALLLDLHAKGINVEHVFDF